MGYPNNNCGECVYWLAFGEPETTDEQNKATLEHCAKCDVCDGRCLNCDYYEPLTNRCTLEDDE